MRHALSLLELNELVSGVIAADMPDEYWVEAEISEAREVRGHCYMDLIQTEEASRTPVAKAAAKCWKSRWSLISPAFERVTGQHLRAGMKVLLKVYADFHVAYGFSWIVTDIDPTYTMGEMARKRQEIIRKLREEGVFDMQKELQLRLFCQRIAVISSDNSAGFGDFGNQLDTNEYGLKFHTELFPAVMQGEQVEATVIGALNAIFMRIEEFDAVVIIRGGGAASDLSGFDTLALAENVANFPLPVITGIGHERDESVLDMVSHTRVKTPTAAAAFLINHLCDVLARVEDAESEIVSYVRHRMDFERVRLARLAGNIPALFSLVKSHQETKLDKSFERIGTMVKERLESEKHKLDTLATSLVSLVHDGIKDERHRLELLEQRTGFLDPQLLLKRGYSITLLNGKAVKDCSKLRKGDEITTKVMKGTIKSIVT